MTAKPSNFSVSAPIIDPRNLYRLPWSKSDNASMWLEPTRMCNLACDACFHSNDPTSHKSLEQIEHELQVMLSQCRCDAMLVAGGEPLTHPQIVDIIRLTKSFKVKPVLYTNGIGLNKSKLNDMQKAGVFGFVFHVDSHQNRPGWEEKTETELNELRQEYAELVHSSKGLLCGFNTTVFPDTLESIPAIVKWARENIHIVHSVCLIAVRMLHKDLPFEPYVGTKKIDAMESPYYSDAKYENLTANDIYRQILKVLPEYQYSSYVGGTAIPSSIKIAIGSHVGTKDRSYGNIGSKTMEILQAQYHWFNGKYFAYSKPVSNSRGKLLTLFGLFDKEIRKMSIKYLQSIIKNPRNLFKKLYIQSIVTQQPLDFLPTGEGNHCDGCPNLTFWNDRLVSACRFEEYNIYGAPVSWVPKGKN